jgi:hypothetical protein
MSKPMSESTAPTVNGPTTVTTPAFGEMGVPFGEPIMTRLFETPSMPYKVVFVAPCTLLE